MKQTPQNINLFKVGSTVTVPGVESFKKTKILVISDSGVTVSSNDYPHTVISGCSPAIPFEEENIAVIKNTGEVDIKGLEADMVIIDESEITPDVNPIIKKDDNDGRVKRGTYTEKMKHITLPSKDKFTIAELAELNGIPNNYANTYAKENLVEAGKVEKIEGQRGKSASLYSKK
jgi:hypothetical protein